MKVKKGTSGTIGAKINGMIKWMQETDPILQKSVRMNVLSAPSYPPDMLRPTPTHQNEWTNL
ncbi:hypothetical protein Godav_023690 [Gossypium davidsonii]|uniref:Uncharacterized protein n=1 Tax=Gossypium davidsonii TaxID=34287 RepID=A0A7J8SSL9_GOSDV|nr:hypothetical protein [Gossypium davidsonii]